MRRIAVFLQFLFYSFIFIPASHSIAPLSVVEFDNIFEGDPTIYTFSYLIGLFGLFCVLIVLNYTKAFLINVLSSLLLIIPIFQYINLHDFWIPAITAIPFVLVTISSILQLNRIIRE
jgi:hypothetical protein